MDPSVATMAQVSNGASMSLVTLVKSAVKEAVGTFVPLMLRFPVTAVAFPTGVVP